MEQVLERHFPVEPLLKLDAITKYKSQLSPWLTSFARKDEVFFPEKYERVGGHWVRVDGEARADGSRVNREGPFVEQTDWGDGGFAGVNVVPAQ